MIVMGIETSCDETAIALIERGTGGDRVLVEKIKSQEALHGPYGGIVPEIASRNHFEYIDRLALSALREAEIDLSDIGMLALTLGPGLIGSLLVGLSFAKGLALTRTLPLVTVDHIHAHIESAFISSGSIEYPLLALVVSGGHTTLFYQEKKFDYRVLAKTRDDAAGEVMDKIAKYFGLGYPGGPILDRLYPEGDPRRYPFTMPRISDGSDDFSFSGYKTAVLRYAGRDSIQAGSRDFHDLLSSFLRSTVDYLVSKVIPAAECLPVRSVIVAGGVSRNSLLRKRFQEECAARNLDLYLPEPMFCTDNASMTAWLGYEIFKAYPDGDYSNLDVNAYSRASFREAKKHR